VLRDPALLWPGDRFIIRMFSPVITIGGGTVLDNGERRYRAGGDMAARLATLESSDTAGRIMLLVKEAPFGMDLAQLVSRTGLRDPEVKLAAKRAGLVEVAQWYVNSDWFRQTRNRLISAVHEFHRANPLLPGISKQDLRSRELAAAPLVLLDALLADTKELLIEGETVRARAHRVILQEDESAARRAIERAFERAGLATPAVAEVLAQSGIEPARARSVLQILLRERQLIRISDDLVFHRSAIDKLRQMMAARKSERFNVSAFKEWTGISRKYAIPLLEYLDRERITRREGDERRVL
jgi:selenocysteine-specific elongation factor